MKKWTLKIECTRYSDILEQDVTNSMEFIFEPLGDCASFVETVQECGVGEFVYNIKPTEEGGAEEC